MRKFNRNTIVLIIAICFAVIGFFGTKAAAQKKNQTKTKATPKTAAKSKTSEKTKDAPKQKSSPEKVKSNPAAKTTASAKKKADSKKLSKTNSNEKITPESKPASTAKPTPKVTASSPTQHRQIIVSAASAQVRSAPDASASAISNVNIGKTFTVLEENSAWYRVRISNNKNGWMPKTAADDFDPAKREEIYQSIAGKYFKDEQIDFATAVQVFDFLNAALPQVKKTDAQADFSLKRLLALSSALKAIPFGKGGEKPYKDFLAANEKEVVYSEPSGEWYPRADLVWELHGQFKDSSVGEEIAWQAAQTHLPGECEGYVNCYLYLLRVTDGEYLNFYPGGKYAKKSLENITTVLEPIVADLKEKTVYTSATDISDRAEFNRLLTELRTIISKVPFSEKAKTIQQINQIGEGFR
ncbi:MAG: SH3 domain-containing protein [Acidobacteriota bacterium]|nr:SH3 domain-containing protein [Acidobacteriota bacterium]